jgi:hypothetical protein
MSAAQAGRMPQIDVCVTRRDIARDSQIGYT